jgi:phage-related protein
MKTWTVHFLNAKVEEELSDLPPDLIAKFLHISDLVQTFGHPHVGQPYIKALHTKPTLWEMRMRGQSGIARALYAIAPEKRCIVVHVFIKKSQKTPTRALEKALKRMEEIL